jgi:hypothetical protein
MILAKASHCITYRIICWVAADEPGSQRARLKRLQVFALKSMLVDLMLSPRARKSPSSSKGSMQGSFTHRFQRLKMHPRQGADDLKMAEFFRSDVHQ